MPGLRSAKVKIKPRIFSQRAIVLLSFCMMRLMFEKILGLILTFAERNPGMCRILNGEVLAGEKPRLRERLQQLFERLETQFKQVLREAEMRDQRTTQAGVTETAQLLLSFADGQISQYVRSNFSKKPTVSFSQHWHVLQQGLLT